MGEEEEDTEPLAGEAMLRILKDKLEEIWNCQSESGKGNTSGAAADR